MPNPTIKTIKTIRTIRKVRTVVKKTSTNKPIKIFKATTNIAPIIAPEKEKNTSISFEKWLAFGKSMGWHVQSPLYPTIIANEDNDQLKRYVDFIKDIDQIVDSLKVVEKVMTKVNENFKTEDKGKIFEPSIIDKVFSVQSTVDYFKVAALEQKEKIYEQQWYSLYQRYKTDDRFKDKADTLLKELK